MIFQPEFECMDRQALKTLQLERLKKTIAHAYNNVPMYKKRLDEANMTPEKFTSLEDLSKLPFTTKGDLRDNYPYGLFAVPMKDIVRIHASSGTTGKPTVVGYTKNDLKVWADVVARIIVAAGATEDDIAQVAFGYGLFTGALGLHYGLENIGATVVPTSSGNTEKQVMLMQDFNTTILVSTPSYALYISEVMEKMGIKKDDIKLKIGLFGAEGATDEMMEQIEEKFGILATQNYGLSEIIGPGVSGDCYLKCGMHIAEDHFITEIINPDTLEVLPDGEVGELVITTITKDGLPMLRYRTKDITSIDVSPCACGRTSARMTKIQGRSDDMLIIKGVNVFPSQIESVIVGIKHISPHYQLVLTKVGYTDALEVVVELADSSLLESFAELEKLEKSIKHKLHTVLGLDTKVRLVEQNTIERSMGKAKRIVDLRGR